MRKTLAYFLVLCSFSASAEFLRPKEFDGSEKHKEQVITYIKERVKLDYCYTLDMCQEIMLRMMESENLDAFKRLTNVPNDRVLNRVIYDYCNTVDMCTYQMIEMMYDENVNAENQELSW